MIDNTTLAMFRRLLAGHEAKLDTPLVRRLYQKNLKRGSTGVVSLLAALAATRVSAAANELDGNAEDYLLGLTPVDDLSAFGENCLPGQSYQAYVDNSHDHGIERGASSHSQHAEHGSYLDAPFASRLDSPFSNGHEAHEDQHSGHSTDHKVAMNHYGEHSSTTGHDVAHTGHENHQGHQASAGHGTHKNAEHSDHDHSAMNVTHGGLHSNDVNTHQGSGHQGHQMHANGAHANHTAGSEHVHGGGHEMDTTHDMGGGEETVVAHIENVGHQNSNLNVDQTVSLSSTFEVNSHDHDDHSGHGSSMAHDLANALMAQAPISDPALLSLPPEI